MRNSILWGVPKKFALKSWSSLGGVLTFPYPLHADQVEFLWSETAGGGSGKVGTQPRDDRDFEANIFETPCRLY